MARTHAVVYFQGKIHYLGLYGSPESKNAYARFIAESRIDPIFLPPKENEKVTIPELAVTILLP